MCRLHADRSIQDCSRKPLPEFQYIYFEVQLVTNETRLAASHENGSVALFRADTEHFQLASFQPLRNADRILFIGDTLLVQVKNDTIYTVGGDYEVLSIAVTGSNLKQHLYAAIGFFLVLVVVAAILFQIPLLLKLQSNSNKPISTNSNSNKDLSVLIVRLE